MFPVLLIVLPGAVIAALGLLLPRSKRSTWIAAAVASTVLFYILSRNFYEGSPADGAWGITFFTLLLFGITTVVKAMKPKEDSLDDS